MMERHAARPWDRAHPPRRLLAIRLQALGDVAITLPYLRALAGSLPSTEIDFVTRAEYAGLPEAIHLFTRIVRLPGPRRERGQWLPAAWLAARLRLRGYDAVLDLQNNRVSRAIRRSVNPIAWSSFDRDSPRSAGERTRRTIEAAGFPLPPEVTPGLLLRASTAGIDALRAAGYQEDRELVVLSPAGAFPTRNWPVPAYIEFARRWAARRPSQFAVLGLRALRPKADALKASLGSDLLDLTGRTTLVEALAILQRASFVVSEDCGLMHMAWVSGVPTLALFGSSRHDWSAPIGPHTRCLHAGDLPCGACMEPECRFGDVHCLTRHRPEDVVAVAESLRASTTGAAHSCQR